MTAATRATSSASRRPGGRPRRAPRRAAPDPRQLAALLVRAWLEVRAGRRPLRQLAPLVAPAVYGRLADQLAGRGHGAGTVAHLGTVARVGQVRACCPTDDVCEAAVTIHHATRTTAVAVRLERHLGLWRAVELTAPESGLAPLTTASLPPGWRPRDAFDEVLEDDA
ncbi:Rv3235 family protein [Egicoccus sp. AB-alg2]|uniref:Rv3235 family protein n=1 Tax=Egicoccus sp. AB-alg2 TaxID=3242693 RepID=UPI00359DF3C4